MHLGRRMGSQRRGQRAHAFGLLQTESVYGGRNLAPIGAARVVNIAARHMHGLMATRHVNAITFFTRTASIPRGHRTGDSGRTIGIWEGVLFTWCSMCVA
jgi:hypothetical protein